MRWLHRFTLASRLVFPVERHGGSLAIEDHTAVGHHGDAALERDRLPASSYLIDGHNMGPTRGLHNIDRFQRFLPLRRALRSEKLACREGFNPPARPLARREPTFPRGVSLLSETLSRGCRCTKPVAPGVCFGALPWPPKDTLASGWIFSRASNLSLSFTQ